MAKKQKVCKLNAKENKVWEQKFEHYANMEGYTPSRADKKVFTELKKEFPRLKKCDKIK
ncbi:MAG: hypothetical protein NT076_02670 [Candidatus Pacearchaeota archaeon]|nr:hypothetical protein [Candidatus Pacearchaeota archaeon]